MLYERARETDDIENNPTAASCVRSVRSIASVASAAAIEALSCLKRMQSLQIVPQNIHLTQTGLEGIQQEGRKASGVRRQGIVLPATLGSDSHQPCSF